MTRTTAWSRRSLALGLAAAALLSLPAAGRAATTFGSRLNHDPANSGECNGLPTPCTLVSFIHPSDPNGDPYSGGAPVAGVITRFRIRAFGEGDAPATVTFRLADISRPNPGDADVAVATAAGTGPTVTIPPTGGAPETPIREFPARLPVRQGNHLAIDGTNVWATYNTSGDKFTYRFAPPLVEGQGPRGANEARGELLVAAVIEADADGDGFGDETQDRCPTQATTQGACDTSAPAVSGLRVAGGRIRFRLSEAASVRIRLAKGKPGRRVRGKCRRPTRRNAKRPRCVRYVALGGTLTRQAAAGANTINLPRIRGRKLGAGVYRLTLTARDAIGNEATVRKTFRVAKKKRRR